MPDFNSFDVNFIIWLICPYTCNFPIDFVFILEHEMLTNLIAISKYELMINVIEGFHSFSIAIFHFEKSFFSNVNVDSLSIRTHEILFFLISFAVSGVK
jgi:hypothetical protein